MRRALLALAGLVSLPALATTINGTGGASIVYTSGGATISDGSGVSFQGRTWETPSNRQAQVVESYKVPVGGNTIDVQSRRTIQPMDVVKAAAAVVARRVPYVAQGMFIWDMFNKERIRPGGADNLEFDPGVLPTDVQAWKCTSGASTNTSNSPSAACGPLFEAKRGTKTVTTPFSCGTVTAGVTSISCSGAYYETGYGPVYWAAAATVVTDKQCQPVVDFEDPSYSYPGGAPGADGKCPTGRYTVPISEAEAASKVENHQAPSGADLNKAAEETLQKGGTIPNASERQLSGPSSVTGTPQQSSTTNPDGTQKSETKAPVTNYTFEGNHINYTTTVITTINNNGQTTTINEQKPLEPSDQCKQNPGSLGCADLDRPDAAELQKKDVPAMVTPQAGWGADGGSCPAPVSTHVLGMPVVVDNTLFCEFLSGIRFAVVASCALAAVLIFMGGFKE
ncbi:virulence factor TspB C-terminal domain-related protein [Paucibacter sediminis]|uniref:Virulence factor TspB C-terminal domain-related protein n=1 Tax=Paucibacter sediminis TaxID=3019553 RepID=A0AA95NK82_9BURK|nr:virulence factor TspB C-terminal domain-related protein [Paucibacter sp. S2-9]WIT11126.1 virulence factor TspB C-terminal domain-related protein [Paucibacter sp. S2-9]